MALLAKRFVEDVRTGNTIDVPDTTYNNAAFREAVGTEVVHLLRHEQDEEAERVVEAFGTHGDIVHSDQARSAARQELTHLEASFVENLPRIRRLMNVFDLGEEEVVEELRPLLRMNPPEYREAA